MAYKKLKTTYSNTTIYSRGETPSAPFSLSITAEIESVDGRPKKMCIEKVKMISAEQTETDIIVTGDALVRFMSYMGATDGAQLTARLKEMASRRGENLLDYIQEFMTRRNIDFFSLVR